MIKAALFDLDGVVFDTEPQYSMFWGGVFARFYPGSKHLEQSIKGQTLEKIFAQHFDAQPMLQAEIVQELNAFEQQMDFVYIEGVQAFVKTLRDKGFSTAIVTSSNDQKMQAVYAQHPELHQMFDIILTADDITRSKPHPDGYLLAAQRLHVQPSECIGFEDSFNGLRSLQAAGVKAVGLSTTNSAEAIAPLCTQVYPHFAHLDYLTLIA